jgi:hypothetical protein
MAVGRISGPLLKDNLLRNGQNLAFETNLLYLDVVNSRVGINTATPTNDLSVNGTTRTTNLYTSGSASLGLLIFSGSTISSINSSITFTPSGPNATIYQGTALVGNLSLTGNTLASTNTNGAINIVANGTGAINLNSDVLVTGNLHATGTITADGNIQLGDMPTDTITFAGEVSSNILPATTNTYTLGSNLLRWKNVYSQNVNTTNINAATGNVTSFSTTGTPSITISGNTISANTSNVDINFTTSGTGGVALGNLKFTTGGITNTANNAVTQLTSTGNGYFQFAGTYGVVVPVGNTAQRPAFANSTTGMLRFSTDNQYVEVYNGISWTSVAGLSSGVTVAQASDVALGVVISLG